MVFTVLMGFLTGMERERDALRWRAMRPTAALALAGLAVAAAGFAGLT